MSKPGVIKIDEVEYIRRDSSSPPTTSDIRIVILQRGWVVVGRYSQEGSNCKLENAHVIRVWGTKNGLGELALNGPTSTTVLDKTPTIRFHELTVIATLDCVREKWSLKI